MGLRVLETLDDGPRLGIFRRPRPNCFMRFVGIVVFTFCVGCGASPSLDGGVDGGPGDSGPGDAGPSDAARDALVSDVFVDTVSDVGANTMDAAPDAPMSDGGSGPMPGVWDGRMPDGICTPSGFCLATPLPSPVDIRDMWGVSPDDVWAVGEQGAILHYDGERWTGITGRGGQMQRVYGCASDDVWAIQHATPPRGPDELEGEDAVLHWNGELWEEEEAAGRCTADTWWLADGVLERYDGAAWAPVDIGFSTQLDAMVTDGTTAWAVGRTAAGALMTVVHDGTDVEVTFTPDAPVLRSLVHQFGEVWAATANDVLQWDGSGWVEVRTDVFAVDTLIATPGQLYVYGQDAWSAATTDGVVWNRRVESHECAFMRSRAVGAGGEVWFVNNIPYDLRPRADAPPCNLLRRDQAPVYEARDLQNLRLVGPDQFLVVEGDAVSLRSAASGATTPLATLPSVASGPPYAFLEITDDHLLWAARDGGMSARFDGSSWTEYPTVSPLLTQIVATADEAWAIGSTGAVEHWTAAEGWVAGEFAGTADSIQRLGPDFWISGPDSFSVWTGTEWALVPNEPGGSRVVLRGYAGPGQAWALAVQGTWTLLRWTGSEWQDVVALADLPEWHGDTLDSRHPIIDAYEEEIWIGGYRYTDGSWVSLSTGLTFNLDRVEVEFGQVWLFENDELHVTRLNL